MRFAEQLALLEEVARIDAGDASIYEAPDELRAEVGRQRALRRRIRYCVRQAQRVGSLTKKNEWWQRAADAEKARWTLPQALKDWWVLRAALRRFVGAGSELPTHAQPLEESERTGHTRG